MILGIKGTAGGNSNRLDADMKTMLRGDFLMSSLFGMIQCLRLNGFQKLRANGESIHLVQCLLINSPNLIK